MESVPFNDQFAKALQLHLDFQPVPRNQMEGLLSKETFLGRLIAVNPLIVRAIWKYYPQAKPLPERSLLLAFRSATENRKKLLAGMPAITLSYPSVLRCVLSNITLTRSFVQWATKPEYAELISDAQSCDWVIQVAEEAFLNANKQHAREIIRVFPGSEYMQILSKQMGFTCQIPASFPSATMTG